MSQDLQWEDARRIEAWAGEVRVNLIRLVAILFFFGHHLINVYVLGDPSPQSSFHSAVTMLVAAWAGSVVLIHVCLVRRWMPPALKFVATGWDIGMITMLLIVSGGNAFTMLPVLYFLVIAAAALRLDLPLVYMATLGSMAAYLFWLGFLAFWLRLPEVQRLPRPQQIIFVLALGGAGILAGQMVRQVRRLVQGNPVLVIERKED